MIYAFYRGVVHSFPSRHRWYCPHLAQWLCWHAHRDLCLFRSELLMASQPDCYLRQVAGGTEFARFGSSTCLLRWFISVLKRISARNLKNTVCPSKNAVWRSKTTIFENNTLLKQKYVFSEPFPLFKGPGRAHVGPDGPLWANMDPKNPKKHITNRLTRCL